MKDVACTFREPEWLRAWASCMGILKGVMVRGCVVVGRVNFSGAEVYPYISDGGAAVLMKNRSGCFRCYMVFCIFVIFLCQYRDCSRPWRTVQ